MNDAMFSEDSITEVVDVRPDISRRLRMGELDGKTAIVTGAAGDIGLAISTALIEAGAMVIALDRLAVEQGTEQMAAMAGDQLRYRSVDVTDRAAVEAAPALDIVIGNAGVVEPMPFLDVTPESWQRQLDINLTGNFHLSQLSARRFRRDGTPGSITLTGSWVGERPWPEIAPYSATKAAIQMLVRSMALELAGDGIRCNLVAPGIVDAGLARAEARRNPEYARRAAEAAPLGSLQTPEDVAGVVRFLVGPAARSITGGTYLVDGGSTLGNF
jgi:NAD(P)-dependent dehydrogenase (short-subunit alcohol dehydrogenase family)